MTDRPKVAAEDVYERVYRWGWWEGVACDGDALTLALEMQALDADVVAVLDLQVASVGDRVQIAAVTLLGPVMADTTVEERSRFIQADVGPRYRTALMGDPCDDGWRQLDEGHWQLHLVRA